MSRETVHEYVILYKNEEPVDESSVLITGSIIMKDDKASYSTVSWGIGRGLPGVQDTPFSFSAHYEVEPVINLASIQS